MTLQKLILGWLVSILHVICIGLVDALIKGNIVAHYQNWALVPWYFKDQNIVYPFFVFTLFLVLGIIISRKGKFGLSYLIFIIMWALGGLESLSYWFWITTLDIGQTLWWLPDSSRFWWYPQKAPWLNIFIHLKWLSQNDDVTRQGLLKGVHIVFVVNTFILIALMYRAWWLTKHKEVK